MQPEAKFKKALISAYLEIFPNGWHNYNPANRRIGIPDLYFTLPHSVHGVPLWIEAKVKTKVTPIQYAVLAKLRRAGNVVRILRASGMDEPKHERRVILSDYTGNYFTTFLWAEMKSLNFWEAMQVP
jgi:hypothetical protein